MTRRAPNTTAERDTHMMHGGRIGLRDVQVPLHLLTARELGQCVNQAIGSRSTIISGGRRREDKELCNLSTR